MAKMKKKPTEHDERNDISYLYKVSNDEVIDKKIKQFTENGVKFIRYSCEIPTNELGKTIKHDIVMTIEAFNKLSAAKKKLFMGGL